MKHSLRLATLAASAIMLASVGSVARAQDSSGAPPAQNGGPPPGGRMGMRGGRMGGGGPEQMLLRGITLTDAQHDSLGKLNDAMNAKMDELRKRHLADIRATLTSDQQATFDKNVAEAGQFMAQRRNRAPGGPPPGSPSPQ